jgi:hypothetical protein
MRNPKVEVEIGIDSFGDIFVIADGVKIAMRGHLETKHAGSWISLEPGWTVRSPKADAAERPTDALRFHEERLRFPKERLADLKAALEDLRVQRYWD